MTDIYMNGAEVHAETPEEEREASLILNAALSGKTTLADGSIGPDEYVKAAYFYARHNLVTILKRLPAGEKAIVFMELGDDLAEIR